MADFLSQLAERLSGQPHEMQAGKKKVKVPAHRTALTAKLLEADRQRKLIRPDNPMKSPRSFMEGPGRPPLSYKG